MLFSRAGHTSCKCSRRMVEHDYAHESLLRAVGNSVPINRPCILDTILEELPHPVVGAMLGFGFPGSADEAGAVHAFVLLLRLLHACLWPCHRHAPVAFCSPLAEAYQAQCLYTTCRVHFLHPAAITWRWPPSCLPSLPQSRRPMRKRHYALRARPPYIQ